MTPPFCGVTVIAVMQYNTNVLTPLDQLSLIVFTRLMRIRFWHGDISSSEGETGNLRDVAVLRVLGSLGAVHSSSTEYAADI